MSFRRQADNFMKWREGGVVPVDAFFIVSGRALNARQNRIARRRPGQYYCFDREQEYSDRQQQSDEIRKTSSVYLDHERERGERQQGKIKESIRQASVAPPVLAPPVRRWMYFWRPVAEPYSLGPIKIKNGDERKWLTLTLVEEEVLSDGEQSNVPGYSERDFPTLVNLAMRSIWGPHPSDFTEAFHRKWKITHSERIA